MLYFSNCTWVLFFIANSDCLYCADFHWLGLNNASPHRVMIELIIVWFNVWRSFFVRFVELIPELLLDLSCLTPDPLFVSSVTTASLLDP